MSRTQPLIGMAVAVLSLLVLFPSAAAAENDPDLTYPTGTLLAVNPEAPAGLLGTAVSVAKIKLSNETVIYQCDSFTFTGSLEKNTGSLVEATLSSATFKSCTTGSGGLINVGANVPWCLRSTSTMAEDEFQIRGNACNLASRPTTIAIGSCTYERTTPVSGQFATDIAGQDAILSVTNMELVKEANQPFCVSPTTMEFIFTLELDTTTSADPIYLS